MISTQEILNRVFSIIKPLELLVNGGIYKEVRPPKSNKEDIVLNLLTSEPSSAQQTIINVNIYVKDLNVELENEVYYAPNSKRLLELENDSIIYLKESYHDDLFFYCVSVNTIKERGTNEHFLNFRLLVTTIS